MKHRLLFFLIILLVGKNIMMAKSPINLNKAEPSDLIELGVPTEMVKSIVLYRDQINGYDNIRDLKKIPGMNSDIYKIIEDNFFVTMCEEYKLFGGDILVINFAGKIQEHTVSPDGFIYITAVGRLNVKGKTVLGIQEDISRKTEAVTVDLKTVANRVAVVGFSLSTARVTYYPGRLSSIISQMGGVSKGMKKTIKVIRHNEFNQPSGNYEIFYADKLNQIDPFIQNGDVVIFQQKNIYRVSDTLTAYGSVLLWPLQVIGQALSSAISAAF